MLVCVLFGALVVGLCMGLEYYPRFDWNNAVLGVLMGTLCGILFGSFFTLLTIRPTDEIEYIEHTITISDDVSFNEFMEHYDIIDQQGDVYTVREKR